MRRKQGDISRNNLTTESQKSLKIYKNFVSALCQLGMWNVLKTNHQNNMTSVGNDFHSHYGYFLFTAPLNNTFNL